MRRADTLSRGYPTAKFLPSRSLQLNSCGTSRREGSIPQTIPCPRYPPLYLATVLLVRIRVLGNWSDNCGDAVSERFALRTSGASRAPRRSSGSVPGISACRVPLASHTGRATREGIRLPRTGCAGIPTDRKSVAAFHLSDTRGALVFQFSPVFCGQANA
jgi:hypothetical protein